MKRPLRTVLLSLLGVLAAVVVGSALHDLWRHRDSAGDDGITGDGATGMGIPRRERSVLLITVDTTRADRLEPYGADDVATPTFARLAREGIVFEHAYAVAPITLVAHTSILTGLYPPEHGVRNNGTHYVPEELETLAERLAERGYRTAAFVSASVLEERYGLSQGFELYDDDLSAGRERHPRMVPDRPASATVDSAVQWLEGLEPEERFFAWVHFYDPHAVYSPPAPYRDTYRERLYDGEIAYMDAEIGRLLDHPRLRREPELLTVVLGDHGESLGEHGEQTHAILAYDSTLRVPFLLHVDGGPAGIVRPEPVGHVDLVPTVLDLLGQEVPAGLPGRSVVSELGGDRSGRPPALYSETYLPYYTYGWAKLRVLRRGPLKYVDAPTPELYDLRRDPHELSNQIEHQPGIAHDLARDLEELLRESGDPEREATLELDAEAADKLRSLGYLAVGSLPEAEEGERPDPKEYIELHVGLERARRLMRDQLYPQAAAELRALLARDPGNLAALIELANALELAGEVEEGIAVAERALGIDPGNPRLHLQLATFEARRGDREQAVRLADAALEIDPRYLEARLQKAIFLQQLGQPEEASEVLRSALDDSPDHPRLNALYAQLVELRRGEVEAAEERLRQSLEADPFLPPGYRFLGELLARTGRVEEAMELYREGLSRHPDDAELHARLGLLLADRGGGAETERHLEEAIRLSRDFRPELHVAHGGWLAEHGRLEEAEREYRRVLERDPKHPGARNNRAIAYYRTGRPEEAIRELRELVADFPRHADAHNNLAAIAVERGDWRGAEEHSRRALEVHPGLVEAWNNLGVGLEGQERFAEAEEAYRHALELAPGYWQGRFNLGVLLRKTDRPDAALEELEAVLRVVPGHPEPHLELGALHADLGHPDRARIHWNAFLRAAPRHPRAEEIRRRLAEL